MVFWHRGFSDTLAKANDMITENEDRNPKSRASGILLSPALQRRNIILYAIGFGMNYLAAPVLYVGTTQAALCDRLGADARTANLPGSLYFAMTAMPVLLAWLSPKVAHLKRNLSFCFALMGGMLLCVAFSLASDLPDKVKIGVVILQAVVSGAVMTSTFGLLWEALARGTDESLRGKALGLAFGAGPLLAVLGSFLQTFLLGGDLFGWKFDGIGYPLGFVILFGICGPIMLVSAVCSLYFVIPPVERELERDPVYTVVGLLIGLPSMCLSIGLLQLGESGFGTWLTSCGYAVGFLSLISFIYHYRSLLSQRVLLIATLVTILIYCGNVIPSNMNLYAREALGDDPARFAGVQNMLRFGFKVVAGLTLGWLLTKTHPKGGIIATGAIFFLGQIWAMCVTGPWYLLASGLHGAGELIGVYAPNYIVSASSKNDLRRNMAFVTMLMVPAAPAGYLYGAIVEHVKSKGWSLWGMNGAALGFRISFAVCATLILAGIILALVALPRRPRPQE